MHKTLLSLAACIAATALLTFSLAALLRSVPASQAQDFGPVVTGGEAPWVTVAGSIAAGTTSNVYTVPADRIFVLAGACASGQSVDLKELDSAGNLTLLVEGSSGAMYCTNSWTGGFLGRGTGHVVFEPGSQVQIRNDGSNTEYYTLNGYLAAP